MILFVRPQGHARRQAQSIIGVPACVPDQPTRTSVLVNPANGCRAVLVFSDVANELPLKAIEGSEDAPRNNVVMNLREPSFDLVDPVKIVRGTVHPNGGVALEKLEYFPRLIRTGVVDNDVDLAAGWLTHHNLGEEIDELRAFPACARWSEHLFLLTVQSAIKRKDSAGAAGGNWKDRV
jgi:hypothetical protein